MLKAFTSQTLSFVMHICAFTRHGAEFKKVKFSGPKITQFMTKLESSCDGEGCRVPPDFEHALKGQKIVISWILERSRFSMEVLN